MRAVLRLSWRDIRRSRGRSALIMAMIGLPVLVISCAMALIATVHVTPIESLTSRIGAAQAEVRTTVLSGPIEQQPDGWGYHSSGEGRSPAKRTWTTEQVAAITGGRLLPMNQGSVDVWAGDGYDNVSAIEVDLRDPITRGLRVLREGRVPASPDEVVVSDGMTAAGVGVGDTIKVTRGDRQVRVVGAYEHRNRPAVQEIIGLPGVLLLDKSDGAGSGWLIDASKPVTWDDVRQANQSGLLVASRAVISDPPPHDDDWSMSLDRGEFAAGVGAAVVMVVLETVLLAGPAFAVGLRRRRRELAMISAHGGSPAHLRAIVLADGLILGGTTALAATVLGVLIALAGAPLVGRLTGSLGPYEVPWLYVLGVTALGLLSGLLAALVPAVQAGRQPAAQVLAGRTPEVHAKAGRPKLGLALVVAGLGATYLALRGEDVVVLAAAVLIQLGLVALMPWLVRVSGGLAGRLPLPMRLSVRDASRHRARTASAAAAVMATTTTVLALAIGMSSNEAASRAAYYPGMPTGTMSISGRGGGDAEWAKVKAAAAERMPGVPLVDAGEPVDDKGRPLGLALTTQGIRGYYHDIYGMGSHDLPIGDQRLLRLLQGRDDPQAAAALAAGKAVVFDGKLIRDGMLTLSVVSYDDANSLPDIRVPAVFTQSAQPHQGGAVLARQGVEDAGLKVVERRLYAPRGPADTLRFERHLSVVGDKADVYVEEGYSSDTSQPLLIMLVGALVLVVGGTLVATRLAAADLRPEQATLAAIGAPPMTRRLVLATQAGFIAGLGAVVGVMAGAVTGVAMTWPASDVPQSGPAVVSVPWLFAIAVVVGLPLLAALVGGLLPIRVTLTRRLT